jgi:hypothetical protein
MDILWDLEEPHSTMFLPLWPTQYLPQAFPVRRRIPFHDDEFGVEAEPVPLSQKGIGEYLHTIEEIATIIIVPCSDHETQIQLLQRVIGQ